MGADLIARSKLLLLPASFKAKGAIDTRPTAKLVAVMVVGLTFSLKASLEKIIVPTQARFEANTRILPNILVW